MSPSLFVYGQLKGSQDLIPEVKLSSVSTRVRLPGAVRPVVWCLGECSVSVQIQTVSFCLYTKTSALLCAHCQVLETSQCDKLTTVNMKVSFKINKRTNSKRAPLKKKKVPLLALNINSPLLLKQDACSQRKNTEKGLKKNKRRRSRRRRRSSPHIWQSWEALLCHATPPQARLAPV